MRTITKLLALAVLLTGFTALGAQEYKTREVTNAPAFTAIEVSGGDVNVYFTQGEGYAFTINGPAKLVKATKVKVKENTLFIDYNPPFFTGDDDDVNLYVTAPALSRVAVSGEADFKVKNAFNGQEITLKTRQNGEISMKNVTVGKVNIDAKGSSSVDIDYLDAQQVTVSSQDRAEVELSGTTVQMNVVKRGMLAEIDTKKLTITQPTAPTGQAATAGRVAKDGSVEFSFND